MAWVILDTKPTWNVTDQELIKRMSYALLENGNADATSTTLLTTMFSIQEFLDNLNLIQERFMRDCAPVVLRGTFVTTAGVNRYPLPTDWIHTRRMTWQAQAGGNAKSLATTDSFQLDHGMLDWERNTADPTVYNEGSDLPTLTVELGKAPVQAGTLGLLYVPQPATLDGTGVKLTVPDEVESAILYGTMGELLSSEGEGFDGERAEYCEQRYQLCVELANALIMGSQPQEANG